jgi:ribonuclease HI
MEFIQINLQHNKEATATLSRILNGLHSFISLIQEPYLVKGVVRGLNQKNTKILAVGPRPRACIAASTNSGCTIIPELCCNDLVAAVVNLGQGRSRAVVASAYFPFDSPGPPPTTEFTNLVEWCKTRQLPLLVGIDANAHHLNWGSTDCNARGNSLMDYIASENLELLNQGNEPTFITRVRKEVLDITLMNQYLTGYVQNWRVSDEPSLSDHRHIRFSWAVSPPKPVPYRNPRKTDWTRFQKHLERLVGGRLVPIRNPEDVENELRVMNDALLRAYHDACPLTTPKKVRPTPWWSRELADLRRKCRKAERDAKRIGSFESKAIAQQWQRKYKYSIREAKNRAWRKQCQELEKVSDAARLYKVLSKGAAQEVGFIKNADGTHTDDQEASMARLMEVHFPGSTEIPGNQAGIDDIAAEPPSQEDRDTAYQIISEDNLRWAIGTFSPYKSPGTDTIYPVMLQKGLPIISRTLCRLFRVCLAWGYMPKAWRKVRVVFIPKPGRKDYSEAKSFRPISLSSFLLKTMEKLIDRHIRDTVLSRAPVHQNQHAYQPGKSTETALHALVSRAERAIHRRQYALGAFFDIEGAFDNAPFEAMERSLSSRGTETAVARWVSNMLKQRIAETTIRGSCKAVKVAKGCPQGGVLSPLLWTLVVDELLDDLEKEGIYCQAYADDGTILVEGMDLATVCRLIESGLRTVSTWCAGKGLSINPSKTELLLFTTKYKIIGYRAPRINNVELNLATRVKYLGVILDGKLSFKAHLEEKCEKAIIALWQCRRAIGAKWGLKPRVMHWLYTMVVRPIILYGAVVWWGRTDTGDAQARLGRVQRLACLCITGAMSTTSTAALEVVTGLVPLDIKVKSEAMKTCHRLCRLGLWWSKGHEVGHRRIRKLTMDVDPILRMRTDNCLPLYSFGNRVSAKISQRGEIGAFDERSEMYCFTDGSKDTRTGLSGAGIFSDALGLKEWMSLGRNATVFQTEVYAIHSCATLLLSGNELNRPVTICTDSLAALTAVTGSVSRSKLVQECKAALSNLNSKVPVTIMWIPGHSGIAGNEEADVLARTGSRTKPIGPEPILGITRTAAKKILNDWALVQQETRWRRIDIAKQAKELIKPGDCRLTGKMLGLRKEDMRLVVRLLTGHCNLRYHRWILGLAPEPDCLCGETRETAKHVLCECGLLNTVRQRVFGTPIIQAQDVHKLEPHRLVQFIKKSGKQL